MNSRFGDQGTLMVWRIAAGSHNGQHRENFAFHAAAEPGSFSAN